jgi:uncharacterized membrane protein YgdD (TMEM256/DUF423 family)
VTLGIVAISIRVSCAIAGKAMEARATKAPIAASLRKAMKEPELHHVIAFASPAPSRITSGAFASMRIAAGRGEAQVMGSLTEIADMASLWILAASLSGAVAVAAGAAASHLLADDPHRFALMSSASQYAIYHALALLAVAALTGRGGLAATRVLAASGWLFLAGTVLFSGALYGLALTGNPLFSRPAPYGGTAFMLGWAMLGVYGVMTRASFARAPKA